MKLIALFYIKTIKMHVLKLVNKMKWSTRMPLLNDGPWISCGLRLGPMTSLPGRHAKACCTRHPMPKQCHKERRAETWSTKRKTWLKLYFVCKTYFLLAILQLSCKYMPHCLDSIVGKEQIISAKCMHNASVYPARTSWTLNYTYTPPQIGTFEHRGATDKAEAF